MTTPIPILRTRFENAWLGVRAQSSLCQPAFDRLLAAYSEPHRHYHTLAHIDTCLAWLTRAWSQADRPHEVALAIWYHDAVYDPLSIHNEAQSAALAAHELTWAGVNIDATNRITTMIHATSGHAPSTGDTALLLNIDLASLGAPAFEFARNEEAIRKEYSAFDTKTYAAGHADVLRRLGDRDPLYQTPMLAAELEEQARENIRGAIARWDAEAKR